MEMLLTNLDPHFLKIIDDKVYNYVSVIPNQADGLQFLCPLCYIKNNGPIGTHSIICWKPSVSQTFFPIPGRWDMSGGNFSDLSLHGKPTSSVSTGDGSNLRNEVTKECNAHFILANGKCTWG